MSSLNKIKIKILRWYFYNKRNFPWRHTKDPYKIMIAEFMLHRTKAEQVVPVYETFIKQYPDIFYLYHANKKDIKKVTLHLGLHWRSEHFIKAAKFIIENYKGKFPETPDEILKIPGVGEYATGAILTVCFNKKYPVVDSNIARFINRLCGLNLTGEIRRKKEIINIAVQLFDVNDPGKFIFAIIDFTALICKPRIPDCKICIVKINCNYFNKIRDKLNK